MRNYIVAIMILAIGTLPAWGDALDPSRIGMGARSLGLGRAQAAGEDLASVFINPANAATISKFTLTSMYSTVMEDVKYSMLGLAFPLREGAAGTICISYMGAGIDGIAQTSRDSNDRAQIDSTFDYSNQLMTFSYGKELTEKVAWGGSFKLFLRNFEGVDQGSASGFDLDAGILMKLSHNLRCGVSLQNFLPPPMASLYWATDLKEDIPLNMKMGLGYTPRKDINVLGDCDSLGNLHLGVEWWPREMLALRLGCERMPTGISSASMNYTTGVGLCLGSLIVDYAYYLDSVVSANSSHYFSLGLQFGHQEVQSRPILPAEEKIENAEVASAEEQEKVEEVVVEEEEPEEEKIAESPEPEKPKQMPEGNKRFIIPSLKKNGY